MKRAVVHLKCRNVLMRRPAWVGGWGGSPRGGCCSLRAGLAMMGSRPCTSAAREICGAQRSKFTRRGSLDRSRAQYLRAWRNLAFAPAPRTDPVTRADRRKAKGLGGEQRGRRRACLRGPTLSLGGWVGSTSQGQKIAPNLSAIKPWDRLFHLVSMDLK